MLGDLWNPVRAYCQHSDQGVNSRPSSGPRPIPGAFPMPAELSGNSADRPNPGLRPAREAQALRLDGENASCSGPTKGMAKIVGTGREPAKIRECMDSGGNRLQLILR